MIEKNKSLSVFLLHFLERLNGCESIEKKVSILFSALTRMFPKPTFAP